MSLSHISDVLPKPPERPRPKTLHDLVEHYERIEALDNEDAVVPASSLKFTTEGELEVPGRGRFAFTEWSRSQLASTLGVKFDRWFQNAEPEDRADEMNRRFQRADFRLRIRTRRPTEPTDVPSDGIVRALVTEHYSPIKDSTVARMMVEALSPTDPELPLIRFGETDKTASFVVRVGKSFHPDSVVGDLQGGVLLMNSGVGACALRIVAHLTRLLCTNGMCVPVVGGPLFRRAHRGIAEGKLRQLLADRLVTLPGALAMGADRLRAARGLAVAEVEDAVRRILNAAHLPLKLLKDVMEAYRKEPEQSAFGVAQAITRAAQDYAQELRLDLERAAGVYLQRFASQRSN